ncbi:MAG: redoxin domain-containing protein [Gemmatimonadota bacterium]|nr:redoxin domain-containing protein [Gemmatimonadota bacterium]MDH5282807.1 redoxin domain-containing protein [Gemmatimonadota bacterium]
MTMPAVGAPAPDFTLASTSGSDVTLSSLRGKHVLLAFFPLAFTGVCTAELCAFTEDYARFQGTGTVVLPISVDSVPTLKAFKAREKIGVDLLSDFKREVSRVYGTLLEDKFHSNRAYVLIDRNGVVRWTFAEATTGQMRDNSELLAEIGKLG